VACGRALWICGSCSTSRINFGLRCACFQDLDVAIVKATNHVECPPKDRHLRSTFIDSRTRRVLIIFFLLVNPVPCAGLRSHVVECEGRCTASLHFCWVWCLIGWWWCCRDRRGFVHRRAPIRRRLLRPCACTPPH
jgi:hypothetical protein